MDVGDTRQRLECRVLDSRHHVLEEVVWWVVQRRLLDLSGMAPPADGRLALPRTRAVAAVRRANRDPTACPPAVIGSVGYSVGRSARSDSSQTWRPGFSCMRLF